MKYCHKCGHPAEDSALFCERCGTAHGTAAAAAVTESVKTGTSHLGLTVLGFIFPLIALICYLVFESSERDKALAAAKGGLMNLSLSSPIIALVIYIIAKENYPDVAKVCGICGIISVVLSVLAVIAVIVFYVAYIALILGGRSYYGYSLGLLALAV